MWIERRQIVLLNPNERERKISVDNFYANTTHLGRNAVNRRFLDRQQFVDRFAL
jgi:hypothetical protein